MNINRNNYEEFFLLYLDNELSAEDRSAVELFINENKDLKEEMESLNGAMLIPDEKIFVPKTLLYRDATASGCVEETLLLHLDNELSVKDAAIINSRIAADIPTDTEWRLLQKTKLDPAEVVVFPFKNILYRHTGKLVSVTWWRIAAAILIGIILYSGWLILNPQNIIPEQDVAVVEDKPGMNKQPSDPLNNNKTNDVNLISSIAGDNNPVNPPREIKHQDRTRNVIASSEKKEKDKNISDISNNQAPLIVKQDKEVINIAELPEPAEDKKLIADVPGIIERKMQLTDREITAVTSPIARLASDNESADKVLYMDEDKVTRSMLGGILRKVKRVVERNTKIKTSNSLHIGGYELAIK